MKVRFLPLAILALAFIFPYETFGQDEDTPLIPVQQGTRIYVGPVAGYNRSMHSVDLASFVDDPLCPFFSNGTANGFYAGLSFEYHLGDPTDSWHSIIVRGLYSTLPAGFEVEGDTYPSLVDDGQGGYTTVLSSTRHSIDVEYSYASFEICYKVNPVSGTGFGITVGPTFDFPFTKTMVQRMDLVEPLNVQFRRDPNSGYKYENNDRTIIVKDGDIEGASGFRFGLKVGVQYEILMGKGWYIVPVAYYNYGITKVTPDIENWNVNAFQMGVDVRFAL